MKQRENLTRFSEIFSDDVQRLIFRDISADFTFLAGYIGEFEEVDDHRSGKIVVQLNGR